MVKKKKFAGLNSDTFVEKFGRNQIYVKNQFFFTPRKYCTIRAFLGSQEMTMRKTFFENKWENFYSSSFQKIWKMTFKTKYPSIPRTSMSSNLVNNVAKSKGDIIDLYSENSQYLRRFFGKYVNYTSTIPNTHPGQKY